MRNILMLLYGFVCYFIFFLTFLYAIAFVGGFGVPYTVDHGRPELVLVKAVVIDLIVLGIFAIQHTGMARRGFKRWLTGWMPEPIERSTYVLLSSAALILIFWQWRPLPGVIWDIGSGWAMWLLYALFAFGWLLVLTGTFVINHFDLFGLRQVWLSARGTAYTPPQFKANLYYRIVRHPLMLGFAIAFWAIPRMTAGHLLFAITTTAYILIAVKFFEERDLIAAHGEDYRRYQGQVPMICPWPRPKRVPRKPTTSVPG